MNPPSFGIRGDVFAQAFPFGFLADANGVISVLGRALERRLEAGVGAPVDSAFEVVRPRGPERVAAAANARGGIAILRCRQDDLRLRGQLLPTAEDGAFMFVGTVAVKTLENLRDLGVNLLDFAPQDTTPDLLMLLQANQSSLQDARRLAGVLEETAERERAAAENKARFLAVMSHEIRTTLNGLGSMVDILNASPLVPEQREAVDVLGSSAEQLSAIINDVLDLSRIESGAVTVEAVPLSLHSVCDEVVRLFRPSADERGLVLSLFVSPSLPDWVEGDPMRVRQVLSNLIGNAIKFTRTGGVEVHVAPSEDDRIRFDVTDTGPGISEEQHELLFRPFYQASASNARQMGGTGLGLTICRELVRLMGGEIELTRSSTAGSTFSFTIATPVVDAPAESRITQQDADGANRIEEMRILVAEDHPINRDVMRKLLSELGGKATMVENGEEAVQAVASAPFDIVLMDLGMPVMDGVTACRAIKQLPVAWKDVPVVACTAGVFREDRESARAAGMTGFLTKPFRISHLREALLRVASGRP